MEKDNFVLKHLTPEVVQAINDSLPLFFSAKALRLIAEENEIDLSVKGESSKPPLARFKEDPVDFSTLKIHDLRKRELTEISDIVSTLYTQRSIRKGMQKRGELIQIGENSLIAIMDRSLYGMWFHGRFHEYTEEEKKRMDEQRKDESY